MLTDAKLRSQVDSLWDKLWSGGLTNPMDAIEQLSYLLFLKRLDDQENQRERQAQRRGEAFVPSLPEEMRWRHWSQFSAEASLKHVREKVFPWFRGMGETGSSFQRYMPNAEFKVNKPALLIEACKTIDQMEISAQNQDVQGDLYEYLLSKLNTAGRNGQFRSPRHIIRLMVQMIDPKPGERIGDLAAGTCGFPVNAYQYILESHTSPEILEYDAEGQPHNLVGNRLTAEQRAFLQEGAFRAYDNDSGMAMLRIGSMNLMLHGLNNPRFFYTDTLSKGYNESAEYDVILMNPPFKGAVDKDDVNQTLPGDTTKSELLFLHLILRGLEMGGRSGVIVPDGVLFGSSRAHKEIRRKLIQENRLDGESRIFVQNYLFQLSTQTLYARLTPGKIDALPRPINSSQQAAIQWNCQKPKSALVSSAPLCVRRAGRSGKSGKKSTPAWVGVCDFFVWIRVVWG